MEHAKVEIIGRKIKLRDWTLRDLPDFEKWLRGPQEWKKFDGPYYQNDSEDELRQSLHSLKERIDNWNFPNPRVRLVIANLQDDSLIGTVNSYWISQETNWLAAGITIYDPSFWRGGIGTEALSIWIDFIFGNRPELVRLDLQTWSGNERTTKLAEKLGFTLEGRFRKARIVNGVHCDSIQYGILREEWQRVRSLKSDSI